MRVHPRVRGEHDETKTRHGDAAGSSPRARGTRRRRGRERDRRRFIPACAGNTLPPAIAPAGLAVHPRVRGEHETSAGTVRRCIGSSPRARGTHHALPELKRRIRFIPACAGNTIRPIFWCFQVTVHPRVRGEHPDALAGRSRMVGSSPRARGTRLRDAAPHPLGRFIPACAGNTADVGLPHRGWTVHPRVRGEHIGNPKMGVGPSGSSPRARGTRNRPVRRDDVQRFIPACAGNTRSAQILNLSETVHPRVRGEHTPPAGISPIWHGSSPRARGTPSAVRGTDRAHRFIPACAGNTRFSMQSPAVQPVHPRVRGEHGTLAGIDNGQTGSSPRARGTPAPST